MSETQVHVIRPRSGWSLDLREAWERRELLWVFVWRDVAVRYKQTLIGAAWAVLQPLGLTIVFAVFLGRLAGIGSEGLPYPLFVFAAMVPWTYFSQSLAGAANSVAAQREVITKVYFPRVLLPAAAVFVPLVDLAISLLCVGGMMAWYGVAPPPQAALLPAFLFLGMATALAAGLWFSALNAMYRDVRYVIPFLLQCWFFASPVAYPSSLVPEAWRPLYGLNPMAGVIEGVRWSLLGAGEPPGPMLAVSSAVVLLFLAGGALVFRRMERTFVDVV